MGAAADTEELRRQLHHSVSTVILKARQDEREKIAAAIQFGISCGVQAAGIALIGATLADLLPAETAERINRDARRRADELRPLLGLLPRE